MSNAEIVVVGAGVAGLSAALAVADAGQDVTLVTKADLVESNTYHAQGGIAAAVFADDDPKLHAADTMAAGHGLCEPRAVEILTREGADRVRQFAAAGVHFDRDAQGHMLRGLEAAHSRARVVHAGGDATGKVVELDVSAMVRANPLIHIIEHAFLEDLIVRDGAIAGVRLLVRGGETFRSADMAASRVILATGGAGRLYPYTTNPAVATADGLAAAWRAGAQVADVEFYQFHPTAMAVGEHFLVSEAVRGEGAVLLDEHGERYMTRVDERAELAPRDVVARENFRVMQAQGGKPVMLDVSPMRRENPDLAEFLRHRFPTIDAYTRSLGFDWSKEPIPVAPAAHYYMGGIRTDLNARTSIPGLYAAGECARTGVMGSNRLASNSMMEAAVYADAAARHAISVIDSIELQRDIPAWDYEGTAVPEEMALITQDYKEMQQIMTNYVGIVRSNLSLKRAMRRLEILWQETEELYNKTKPNRELCELRNMIAVAYLVIKQGREIKESVGCHYNADYPKE